jgi:hypothetical protein
MQLRRVGPELGLVAAFDFAVSVMRLEIISARERTTFNNLPDAATSKIVVSLFGAEEACW